MDSNYRDQNNKQHYLFSADLTRDDEKERCLRTCMERYPNTLTGCEVIEQKDGPCLAHESDVAYGNGGNNMYCAIPRGRTTGGSDGSHSGNHSNSTNMTHGNETHHDDGMGHDDGHMHDDGEHMKGNWSTMETPVGDIHFNDEGDAAWEYGPISVKFDSDSAMGLVAASSAAVAMVAMTI